MRNLSVLFLALLPACDEPEPPRLSGVLITVDTTNPGALDIYGSDRGLTPNLKRLAEESLVFDQAWSVAPLTLPSHSSMMTGLIPPRHGIRDNGLVPLPRSAETLAERAQEAGYQTAAFVAAVVLGPAYGLDQGFDVYDQPEGEAETILQHMVERDADAMTREAQTWLAQRDLERPFFLWVHYFDPHAPYEPSISDLNRAGGKPYLGEVARMDRAIGRLLETLEGEVGMDKLWVAVVADHGEALGRHGEPTHSSLCYDATQRVPLLVRFPRGEHAGERSSDTVSVVDIYPTFLEALGLGRPGEVDGRSLLAERSATRGVYVESMMGYLNFGWSPLVGWVQGGRKYLHSSQPEMYDLALDPGEQNDLYAQDPAAAEPYLRALRSVLSRPALERDGDESSVGDRQQELQALGYAGVADADTEIPDPLAPSDRPAPATRMGELKVFFDAALWAVEGRKDEAIEALTQVVRQNPGNVYARGTLGGLLLETRRFQEAEAVLRRLIDEGYERHVLFSQLGSCLAAMDRHEEAVAHFQLALEILPDHGDTRTALANSLEELGRFEEARRYR